jgi:hypothetical protein
MLATPNEKVGTKSHCFDFLSKHQNIYRRLGLSEALFHRPRVLLESLQKDCRLSADHSLARTKSLYFFKHKLCLVGAGGCGRLTVAHYGAAKQNK